MARWNQFSSENLLISLGGHLALAAILLTSFVVVVQRAKLVAPDRIQIMEIDLDSVRVTGDETRLRNINVDAAPAPDTPVPTPTPAPRPIPDSVTTPAPVNAPALVDDAPAPDAPDDAAAPDNKNTPAPTPARKKRVIRVNREVVSLDRTLTVSVVDALRVAMTRCWTIDKNHPGIADIRAVAHLTMRQNGTVRDVWFESAARADSDPAFAYVLDTIRSAINVCQPFRMLPPGEFKKWEKIQLTFYPTQGTVM